jgi:hypothetical protein
VTDTTPASPRDWRYIAAIAVLTVIAVVRVASTYRVFGEVLDEPAHLAAGYQWFFGEYRIDASHPPLERVLGALPLRLAGLPRPVLPDMVMQGNELLYSGDHYEKTLSRARMGVLPLLIVAILATAAWARRAFSKPVAVLAVAIFTTLPPILGHAGIVTTDIALAAALPLALYALDLFLEAPSLRRGAILGVACGIGLLAKFSFPIFFSLCALIVLAGHGWLRGRTRLLLRGAAAALAIAFLVTWAGYRFDFRTARAYAGDHGVHTFGVMSPLPMKNAMRWVGEHVPLPAPAFIVGMGMVKVHDAEGHDSYLLGKTGRKGWWYYFPVVFFYKTPIPFLLLALWGTLLIAWRRERRRAVYPLCAMAILGVAMTSSINIGIRHILPLYAPLAIVAAYAVVEIWKRSTDAFGRTALLGLLVWLFGGVALAHPDYLAWFNEAAQPNPARIAVDSNLDWGQDSLRLARVLREMQIADNVFIDITTNVQLDHHGVHSLPFDPKQKVPGWLAVSETQLAMKRPWGDYAWLEVYRPARRIGQSIRLYFIP